MNAMPKKPGKSICVIAVAIFVAFAGFTAYTVSHLSAEVDNVTIASKNGIPAGWTSYSIANTLSSQTSSEIVGDHVVYTTAVTNTDLSSPTSVTHVASYIDGETRGFLPLNSDSLEYSYYPDTSGSWTPVAVISPGEDEDSFKLSSEIYLGAGDSSNSTVYFRYSITPSRSGTISDKVAFLAKNIDDEISVAISDNSIAYEPTTSDETVAISESDQTPAESASGEEAFAEPLGVTSDSPIATAIPVAAIGAIFIPADIVTGSLIALVICLGIFTASLVAYLISRKKEEQKNRLF